MLRRDLCGFRDVGGDIVECFLPLGDDQFEVTSTQNALAVPEAPIEFFVRGGTGLPTQIPSEIGTIEFRFAEISASQGNRRCADVEGRYGRRRPERRDSAGTSSRVCEIGTKRLLPTRTPRLHTVFRL